MQLEDLGYNDAFEKFRNENHLEELQVGRIVSEHKERYIVKTIEGELEGEITGNMRFTAQSREDFPAVGDWVALTAYDSGNAIIHSIFPRYSVIKRRAINLFGEIQIIAVNIDFAFLVQAVDRDYNINRLERYLTICNSSNVVPIIVLTKTDLIEGSKRDELISTIKTRINSVPVYAISNETQQGLKELVQFIKKGKTYCMLGSSGVGKSTLLNNLSGKAVMRTDSISQSTSKGRHVTSHRELIMLENGGLLIDNPGMREVGIADSSGGLEATFDRIMQLSPGCKYQDCTHTVEAGCAVLEAVKKGELDEQSYNNYVKMEKEKRYFESTVIERKDRDKKFGKFLKNYKKDMKRNDE